VPIFSLRVPQCSAGGVWTAAYDGGSGPTYLLVLVR